MTFPVEVWSLIIKEYQVGRSRWNSSLNADIAPLARVNRYFRDVVQQDLYSRIYLGRPRPGRTYTEVLTLLARTLEKNAHLAGIVREIHMGVIDGTADETAQASRIVKCLSDLHTFEMRGWAERGVGHIFKRLLEKTGLRTLILSPQLIQGAKSRPLCNPNVLCTILEYLPQLEVVIVDEDTCSNLGPFALDPPSEDYPDAFESIPPNHVSQERRSEHHSKPGTKEPYIWPSRHRPKENACPHLRRLELGDSPVTDAELHRLVKQAPNIRIICVAKLGSLLYHGDPDLYLNPALHMCSSQLVRLILPQCDIRSWTRVGIDCYATTTERNHVAKIIADMPSLRVLGIPQHLFAPRHFREGPKLLTCLNYYVSDATHLPELVTVLENGDLLSCLRQMGLSLHEPLIDVDGPATKSLKSVLKSRGVQLHKDGRDWDDEAKGYTPVV